MILVAPLPEDLEPDPVPEAEADEDGAEDEVVEAESADADDEGAEDPSA